jgi:hypothetical protein
MLHGGRGRGSPRRALWLRGGGSGVNRAPSGALGAAVAPPSPWTSPRKELRVPGILTPARRLYDRSGARWVWGWGLRDGA